MQSALRVEIYNRHVAGGESMRHLAREHRVYPSTILRAIRSVEVSMSDHLFALAAEARVAPAWVEREARRILRRMQEPGAVLLSRPGLAKAAVLVGSKTIGETDAETAAHFRFNDWIRPDGEMVSGMVRYAITARGVTALRRLVNARQGSRPPLLLRREIFGEAQVDAARRLQDKFSEGGLDAVRDELAAVGPDLDIALIELVCYERGLEATEARHGWPQRAGKLLMKIALSRLATHYGSSGAPSP